MNISLRKILWAGSLLLPLLIGGAAGASWNLGGQAGLTLRGFAAQPRWPGQDDASVHASLEASLEARWRGEESRASIIPWLRLDAIDQEASLFDLHEAYWARQTGSGEWLIGFNTVFWGVTESVHLVDIVNQTDAVADIDGEDKLGQPMINLEVQRDWGQVGIYLLPYFRERSFAGVDGRLRTPLPVDTDRARFESSEAERQLDLALRYSHYFGSIDIGISAFSGTSREPRLLPDANGEALIPVYDQIDQFGIDLQYTGDAWLWKLEAIARDTPQDSFTAAVGGFEYSIYQLTDTAADLGLLLEGQYDGRAPGQAATQADNDLFAGLRLALNDSQDSTLLAGVGYDLESGETFVNIEGERRLGESSVVELRARMFSNAEPGDLLHAIEQDDYVQLRLSRYF